MRHWHQKSYKDHHQEILKKIFETLASENLIKTSPPLGELTRQAAGGELADWAKLNDPSGHQRRHNHFFNALTPPTHIQFHQNYVHLMSPHIGAVESKKKVGKNRI